MKVDDCDICSILPPQDPVFDSKYWVVSLSPDQGYLGRCYVTLKEHKSSMSELTSNEWLDFAELVRVLENAIRLSFGSQVFNWGCLMNNAFQHSPAKPHVHWHVRPRYGQTINFAEINFEDPLFGYHYDREQSQIVTEEVFQKIKNAIIDKLA